MTQQEEHLSEIMNLVGYGLAKFDLAQAPKLSWFQNPLSAFDFESKAHHTTQLNYYSQQIIW